MLFNEYENESTENYLKAAILIGWLKFSWVKELSLAWLSIITDNIRLKEVHNVANKCLTHRVYKTS